MSRGKNTIKSSDVSTTPIKLKYSASYSSTELENFGISIVRGINTPITSSVKTPQFKINYNLIEQMFYRSHISGSLLGSGSAYNDTLQSTAASGTFDSDIRYFPTQSNAEVVYLYIPKDVFGEQIARKSFVLSSSYYNIYDDGNGNIYDGTTHVGNIIYSQAFVVVTNPNYRCYFVNTEFDYNMVASPLDPVLPTPSVTPTPTVTPSITVTPSTSTTSGVYQYLVNYWTYQIVGGSIKWEGRSNAADACKLGGFIRLLSLYSNSPTFQNGIKLWTDTALTFPFETVSSTSYFKNYVTEESFKYDSSGANVIEQLQSCLAVSPSPTPSITVSTTPPATPSVTPSETPSVTPTPTVTPSKTPSMTPSITPSTTPPATVYYYSANRYDNTCTIVASSVNVRSIEPLLNNFFCGAIDGYRYEIIGPNPGATSGTTIDWTTGAATCAELTC